MSKLKNLVRVGFAAMLAVGLAACGGGGGEMPAPDLGPAQMAAAAAAAAAKTASDDAATAVDAVAADADASTASYVKANDAAKAASDANEAAQAANAAAAAATTLADAEMYRDAAVAARNAAVDAQADAVMYAGMVTTAAEAAAEAARLAAEAEAERLRLEAEAEAERLRLEAEAEAERLRLEAEAEAERLRLEAEAEMQALTDAQSAAAAAAAAAMTASEAAAAAVAAVMENSGADANSYTRAQVAASVAMNAYRAAKAASDAAAMADMSNEAETQQAIAEARQADAEDARADAESLAAMVTAAHNANVQENALSAARMAAKAAADAAKIARDEAEDAVAMVMGAQDANQAAFDKAQAAANAANQAYMDAKAASDAAANAGNPDDAEMYRDTALQKQQDAVAAQDDAEMYAGDVMDDDEERTALRLAKMKANDAADTAEAAYMKAKEYAEAVADSETATADERTNAQTAATNAKIQSSLARNASDRAQEAMYSNDAEDEQSRAEGFQAAAEGYRDSAEKLKIAAETGDSNQEKLTMAQTGAMTAYTEAKRIAGEARQAAEDVATLLGGTHDSAIAAAGEATKAEAARDEAMRLSMAADATMDPDMAADYRTDAETEQGKAQTALNSANHYLTLAKIGVGAAETSQIAAAAREAKKYSDSAQQHYMDAMGKATLADGAADDAEDAVAKARRARTDVTSAMKHEMDAITAKNAANAAATAAKNAAEAAKQAHMDAQAATTVIAAETHRDEAQKQDGIAADNHMGSDDGSVAGAGPSYMAARDAKDLAVEAADRHVLGLFIVANAMHLTAEDIDMPSTTDVNESTTEANEAQDMLRARHVRAINVAIGAQAADADGDTTPNAAGNTASDATVAWAADTPDNPATDEDEFAEGIFSIALSVGGEEVTTAATFDEVNDVERETPEDMESDPLPDEDQVDERNARSTDGLAGFGRGYQMSATDGADRIRALVWTDKAQATREVTAIAEVEVTNVAVTAVQVEDVGSKSGSRYVGVKFDHDTTAEGPLLEGYLSCPDEAVCSIEITDGEVSEIEGYTFTGSREGVEGVMADLRNDYLAFGVWLRDAGTADESDGSVVATRYTFGAFADGGTEADRDALDNAEGTATYRGSAAGVHSTATRVDYFYGKAELTADFDDLEVKGRIHDIYAGGDAVGHEIVLDLIEEGEPNIATGERTASGGARMGPGRTGDDGNQYYPYEGTWSAGFYNPVADDEDTTAVDESETPPGAAAGTFGVESTATGITESYIGAFGAHCSGSNCND